MKKDTFYFSHDYNAHNDVKILFLRQQLGMEGYGIYWFLIESLADSGGILPLKIVPVLSMQMHTTEVKVEAVIKQFDLFDIHEESFFSRRLLSHLNIRKNLSELGKKGAEIRWGNKEENGVANRVANSIPNAKERKGKEKKEKEIKLKGKKYLNIDFNELPNQYFISIIEQMKILKQTDVNKNQIESLWESFKLEKLTGETYYNNENEVYKYFVNWIKNQKFETNGKSIADKKIDAYSEWTNRYR